MLTLTSLNSILDQGYMEFRHAPKTRKYCLRPTNMKVTSMLSKSEGRGALLDNVLKKGAFRYIMLP